MLLIVYFNEEIKYIKLHDSELTLNSFSKAVLLKFPSLSDKEHNFIIKDEDGIIIDEDIFLEICEERKKFVISIIEEGVERESNSDSVSDNMAGRPTALQPNQLDSAVLKYNCSKETRSSSKEMILQILNESLEGGKILYEYDQTEKLSTTNRRKVVNLVARYLCQKNRHSSIDRTSKSSAALGIVALFPSLSDPNSNLGYESIFCPQSSTGYLEWAIKTTRRNSRIPSRNKQQKRNSDFHSSGPSKKRRIESSDQDEAVDCLGAEASLQHIVANSENETEIFALMKASFNLRQGYRSNGESSLLLKKYPRFRDVSGLISQDFKMIFPNKSQCIVEGFSKLREFLNEIVEEANVKSLTVNQNPLVQIVDSSDNDDNRKLLEDTNTVDYDHAVMKILLRLLPPTTVSKNVGKLSITAAEKQLFLFLKSGIPLDTLKDEYDGCQPFVIGVGAKIQSISMYYLYIDNEFVPANSKSFLGCLQELFQAHFVFATRYAAGLKNVFEFIQTALCLIDCELKMTPKVRELRAIYLNKISDQA